MNMNEITANIQYFQVFNHFESLTEIDRYTDYLTEFIEHLVDNMMLLIKSAVEHTCS